MPDTQRPPAQPRALEGVRVLDLTHHIAGPFCTRLLADYGAEVIKVERPDGGDPARAMGPFLKDRPHPDRSGMFLHLNANKRGITLNLKTAIGRRVLLELARHTDILVESFSPRVMPSLGLDYDTLREANPSLVMTSISNFGQTGPYRDFKSSEIITYAMGGPMYATGLPEREPVKLGANVVQFQVGNAAAAATTFALLDAELSGEGDHLDISLMRVQASSQDRRTTMLVGYQYTGEVNERRLIGGLPAVGIRPVADGYMCFTGDGDRFRLVLDAIGMPELLEDPRFSTIGERSRPGRGEEFDEHMLPWLLTHDKREAFLELQAHHIPSGPVYESSDILADPHFRQRGYWLTLDHPATGPLEYTGAPFIMNATPWSVRRPAPRLGEHNREVLCGMLGFSPAELAALRRAAVV